MTRNDRASDVDPQWETGVREPRPDSLLRLAGALAVDPDALLTRCGHLPGSATRRLTDDPVTVLRALRCVPHLEQARRIVNGWFEPRITPERRRLEAILDPGGRTDESGSPSGRRRGERGERQTVKRVAGTGRSGALLRGLREAAGLTLLALGTRLGVDRQLVHQWETGLRRPRPRTLERIGGALSVPADELLGRHGHLVGPDRAILVEHPDAAPIALAIAGDLARVREVLEGWPYLVTPGIRTLRRLLGAR